MVAVRIQALRNGRERRGFSALEQFGHEVV
jgi:hypothetical protein